MNLDFEKYADGLVPAIVQDATTNAVLMLGFMNHDAVNATRTSGRVTFYSRSKKRLWTKGETTENYLELISIAGDCDSDTLLVRAKPTGPVCHLGADTCFGEANVNAPNFLTELEQMIDDRWKNPTEESYVSKLFGKGLNKIAQKVGEEAIETVIAAKDDDLGEFKNEAADLLFHYMVLLCEKNISFDDVLAVLRARKK
ncbi:MAG: bifunctional phosphoribosyl-AMP cyclohydrolase/phosphoribosyl-ATP diphosphatase HisIE [Pyrinomonadaceae bacterium]